MIRGLYITMVFASLRSAPMQQIVGIGAGGHGRVLLETLLLQDEFEVVGFIDDNASPTCTAH